MSGVRKIAKSNFYKIFFIDILEDKEIIDLLKKSEINEKIIKSMHTYASKERKEILFKKSDTIANLKYILDKNEDYDYTFLSKLENQFDEDILKKLLIKKGLEKAYQVITSLPSSLSFNPEYENDLENNERESTEILLTYLNEKFDNEWHIIEGFEDERFFKPDELNPTRYFVKEAKYIAENYGEYLQMMKSGVSQNSACKKIDSKLKYYANIRNDYQAIDKFFDELNSCIIYNLTDTEENNPKFSNKLKELIIKKSYSLAVQAAKQ